MKAAILLALLSAAPTTAFDLFKGSAAPTTASDLFKGCVAVKPDKCGKDWWDSCLYCGTKSDYDCEKCCPGCHIVSKGGNSYWSPWNILHSLLQYADAHEGEPIVVEASAPGLQAVTISVPTSTDAASDAVLAAAGKYGRAAVLGFH